ncbi:MAG: TRAP transporter substrate-binding protein [Gammaproteobacteria bacterium]|nr:TRAP transporter substrate-binding protein [Gammaproteobacteria bacterium]
MALVVRVPLWYATDSEDTRAATTVVPTSQVTAKRWRVPVSFPTNLEVLGDNIIYVAGLVDSLSAGRFQFLIAEPKEIVPEFQIVDAVRENKIPAGYTWLGYDQGKIPASPLLGAVPFGLEPWEFSAWWFEGGGAQLGQELYARGGVHILLCGLIGPETAGWFREPINSLDDLRGLKIRFAGLGGKVIERTGASVTMLPGAEIFQALEKGAIDATEYSLPNVDQSLGFDRVAKLNYFPGWHQVFTSIHLTINLDEWSQLSAQEQAILETACTAGVTRNLAKAEAIQGPIIADFANKGVTANYLPESVLRELNRLSDEVMEEEAANDTDFRRIYDSQRAFRADYAHWKKFAYLPRDF